MGYKLALEMAGATVHVFEEFGSYQGDWLAKVTYKSKTGWINGWYGSCSGCDAFQAEFDVVSTGHGNHGMATYHDPLWEDDFQDDCEECQELKKALAEFGTGYLKDMQTQKEIEHYLEGEASDWDLTHDDMLRFVRTHSIKD